MLLEILQLLELLQPKQEYWKHSSKVPTWNTKIHLNIGGVIILPQESVQVESWQTPAEIISKIVLNTAFLQQLSAY